MFVKQGCSRYTQRKEFEIEGLTFMRFNQFKNKYFKYDMILCADVFCGRGKNVIDNMHVDGSPIKILNGYFRANSYNVPLPETYFWFSDIMKKSCESLNDLITKTYLDFNNFEVNAMSASDAIVDLYEIMEENKKLFLYLILDPNGPKDFPKYEVENLLAEFSKRIDVIPYISTTTINRCIGSRNKAGIQFKGWLNQIEDFDSGFIKSIALSGKRKGWIRKPIVGDPQRWTMIPTFGCMYPRNDWNKQGYVEINSQAGRDAIKFYCGDFKNE